MAETANIAKMAEKVSTDIFQVFGWTRTGPININWECVDATHRLKDDQKRTHPSDVVYWYDDLYTSDRIYVNLDLKSYASGSISTNSVGDALQSLARASDCANKSADWASKYINEEHNWSAVGALFIYNHDGEYDSNFLDLIGRISDSYFTLAEHRRMYLFSPVDIHYLSNIANDLLLYRARAGLPLSDPTRFYSPDLVGRQSRFKLSPAATIEMLLSPWLFVKLSEKPSSLDPTHFEEFVIYYRGEGTTVEEFLYLLDCLVQHQLLWEDRYRFIVRLPFGAHDAAAKFALAIERYGTGRNKPPEIASRLANIKFGTLDTVRRRFSDVELGMDLG